MSALVAFVLIKLTEISDKVTGQSHRLLLLVSLDCARHEHGTENHPLCGWKINGYTNKKSQSGLYNRGVQATIYKKESDFFVQQSKCIGTYEMDVQVPYRIYT